MKNTTKKALKELLGVGTFLGGLVVATSSKVTDPAAVQAGTLMIGMAMTGGAVFSKQLATMATSAIGRFRNPTVGQEGM